MSFVLVDCQVAALHKTAPLRLLCDQHGSLHQDELNRLLLEVKYLQKDKLTLEAEITGLKNTVGMLSKKMTSASKNKAQSL